MNQHKKSNKPMIIGSVVGVLVVVAAFVYLYSDSLFPSEEVTEQSPVEKPVVEAPVELPVEAPIQVSSEEVVVEEKPPVEEPQSAVAVDEGGYAVSTEVVTEPTYVDGVLVANKKYPLPQTYNPGESPEAKKALEQMIASAKKAGYSLVAFSGFRSYEYQTTLYTNYVNRDGKEAADRYSARPGYSEHQTGLAFDMGEESRQDLWLTAEFGETEAGKWLVEHAHEHGFILRYPQGKEDITGFMYESWHFRYVGVEVAAKVKAAGVTLEEYLGIE